jgi:predicted DNA-binding transcriptional regulator AlpA
MKLLTYADLRAAKGIPGSKQTIWRKEREVRFPKRTPMGSKFYGWAENVIDAYVEALTAGCSEQEATRIAERKRVPVMDITPTPEFMEVIGRLQAKGFDCADSEQYWRECELMRQAGDSVCAGLLDKDAKHRAVAAAYPHLYKRQSTAA